MNYSKLQELDYIFTTSLTPLATIIRKRLSGLWFNTDIATHCGLLIDIKGKFFIAEMVGGGLRINSIKRQYLHNGFLGGRIVAVRRNPIYADPQLRAKTAADIVSNYFETLNYDYAGIINHIWDKVKQKPDDFYCSEYINHYAIRDGNGILKEKVSPYDLQFFSNFEVVNYL